MRTLPFLLALLLAGCLAPPPPATPEQPPPVPCADQPTAAHTLFLATGETLANATGPAGEAAANQGADAYLTEYPPWLSAPVGDGVHVEGNATIEVWFRVQGAPLASSGGGEMYIQFGSERSYVTGGVRAQAPPTAPATGAVVHANLTLALPPGGFTLETGSRYALLVTSLVQGAGTSPGITILYGGDTPSQVRFQARCAEPHEWLLKRNLNFPVILPASQGSFTHAIPPQEGFNRLTVPFDLENGTARLTVMLRAIGGPAKNDMDMFLVDGTGKTVYEGATPFANETMVLWPENIAAFLPDGRYSVRVDSYSGNSYSGKLTIVMDEVEGHTD